MKDETRKRPAQVAMLMEPGRRVLGEKFSSGSRFTPKHRSSVSSRDRGDRNVMKRVRAHTLPDICYFPTVGQWARSKGLCVK